MMEEQFASGSSLFHKRSPRVKVIAAASLLTVVAISNSFAATLLALGVALLLLLIADLPPKKIGYRIAIANSFTVFLWLTLPLTYAEEVSNQLQLGPMLLSGEGIRLAALITVKTNTIILLIILLLATSSTADLGYGLQQLGVPEKLCFLLLFSYRYIFVIHEEHLRLKRAALMRGFVPTTSIHTYRTTGYLFGMTLVRSVNRAKRIYQAMQLRGFNGRLTPLIQKPVTPSDLLFLGLFVVFSLLVAWTSYSCPW